MDSLAFDSDLLSFRFVHYRFPASFLPGAARFWDGRFSVLPAWAHGFHGAPLSDLPASAAVPYAKA